MLVSWFSVYYLVSVGSVLPTSTEDDADYDIQAIVTSLTSSYKPFLYVTLTCGGTDTAKCHDFTCSAFSVDDAQIYWAFKPCSDENCQYEPREGSKSSVAGLQVSSNITVGNSESGTLQCFANNSYEDNEDIQEVVPVNNTNQRFLNLISQELNYVIVPNLQEVRVNWTITVAGNPLPELHLRPNNETDLSPEKYQYYVSKNNETIVLTIKNITTNDLDTEYFLSAKNSFENKIFNLTFNISKPQEDGIKWMEIVEELNEVYSIVKCTARSILPCDISWYLKNCTNCTTYKPLEALIVNKTTSDLECESFLKLESSTSGFLTCFVNNSDSFKFSDQLVESINGSIDIFTKEPLTDIDDRTQEIVGEISEPLVLICRASSVNHTDEIQWAWSDVENNTEDSRVKETEDRLFSYQRKLEIPALGRHDVGNYFCKTFSKNGTLEYKTISVKLAGNNYWTYYAIAILFIILIVICIFIGTKMRMYQKLQKQLEELKLIGWDIFEKGALEHLNPNLTIDDQVDLLPYDKRYEFPIDKLKLGEQIGSGAFGVVMKAEAVGVFENEESSTVAVKMVNRNIGDIYIKALASELKIMIHLGKHINIVNLLGACTKNITKRELFVLTEYCRFGNLKDYLLSHRNTFVDQINPETGQIDFAIEGDALGVNKPELTYTTPCFSNRIYEAAASTSKKMDDKNNSPETPQPEDNLHYKGDYCSINKPVCTRDLLLWSFQVARGMEYLSSRKVLHGDLAARNILLTDGNVVKICDFGLSKSMYQQDVYKKKGDEMLPVKWMAIEAITDKIFSVQSDIWSFGVVLWEIFSLARTPYPGMDYSEAFCEKLLDGYRMKSPQYATEEIYSIMLHCWNADPTQRPSFGPLVKSIGSILDQKITEHYIDMNTGYIKMNAQRFKEENSDYLAMVGAPDFKKFAESYVNVVDLGDEVNTYI